MNPRNIRGNLYRGGNLMMGASSKAAPQSVAAAQSRQTRLLPSLRLPLFATMLSGYSSPFFLGAAVAASSETPPYNQALERGCIVLDLLRNKLYKDPIKACVREYICNARDGLREAGTPDKPVRVTLPTELSRQIEIKDEGPGISPRRMGDIFLNYVAALGGKAPGASTKRRRTGDLR